MLSIPKTIKETNTNKKIDQDAGRGLLEVIDVFTTLVLAMVSRVYTLTTH